ncbi:hypothetical protein QTP88_023375 [Uroleucon formosanum]
MFSINNNDTVNTGNTAVVTVAITAFSKSSLPLVCFSCVVVVFVVVVVVVIVDVPPQWSVTERVFADFQCAPSAAVVATAVAAACSGLSSERKIRVRWDPHTRKEIPDEK